MFDRGQGLALPAARGNTMTVYLWLAAGLVTGILAADHGLTIGAHIWVEDKPGWYEFAVMPMYCMST